jgi:drug/metabolite transporter (DMT)-like permease
VLAAAALWGLAIILMRQIARSEGSLLQMAYTNSLFMVATGIACAWHWQRLDWVQVALLGVVCVCGAIGQFCLFEAAPRAPASVMGTVEYSALIWAFVLGFLVFGDVPPLPVFCGAALIMAAGACLVVTERRHAVRLEPQPAEAP